MVKTYLNVGSFPRVPEQGVEQTIAANSGISYVFVADDNGGGEYVEYVRNGGYANNPYVFQGTKP